jgi:hypothetical protein
MLSAVVTNSFAYGDLRMGIVFLDRRDLFVTIKDKKSSVPKRTEPGNWAAMILTWIASYFVVLWLAAR